MGKYKTTEEAIWLVQGGHWHYAGGMIVFGRRGVALVTPKVKGLDWPSRYTLHIVLDGRITGYKITPQPTDAGLIRMAKKLIKQHEEKENA